MGVAAAILGAGVLSAASQIFGATSAAATQTAAAKYATDAQLAMFGITRASLTPYIQGGTSAFARLIGSPRIAGRQAILTLNGKSVRVNPGDVTRLNKLKAQGWEVKTPWKLPIKAKPGIIRDLIKPIRMTQEFLEKTPGYKFNLAQGSKAVQNAAAARGLGASGAALKGAGEYAVGLADRTYQQQFANALANKQMAFNSLMGAAGIGANAAAGLGQGAIQTGGQIGSNIIGAGNAQAGADIAIANAGTGFGNSLVQGLLLQQQLAQQGGGSAGVFS